MHMTPGVSSEVTDINVFWIGPNVTYIIDVLYDARGIKYTLLANPALHACMLRFHTQLHVLVHLHHVVLQL